MTYIKKCYTSPFVGTTPTIYPDLQALEPLDIDGVLVNQLDGISILNTANTQSSNLAVIEVSALPETHDTIALTYTYVGKRFDSDEDGNPTQDAIKLEQAREANKADDRQKRRELNTKLRQVDSEIARVENTIARKDEFRSNREANRLELVAMKSYLVEIRTGVFNGDVEALISMIDSEYEKTDNFRVIEDDGEGNLIEVKYAKVDCLEGVRNADKTLINIIIQAENGLNIRIANQVAAKQDLIEDIGKLQTQLDGVPDEGKNLQQVKADIEAKITELIS